ASDELTIFAARFDIGLALEPGFSMNNNLALSNKIFTYIQAGLALVVSDTDAQFNFLNEYPSIGKTYPKGNEQALADILLNYYQHREQLFETKKAAYAIARQKLNWETESEKFLSTVEKTLNDH
ncbi:MAG TPA: hypothetical protein VK671_03665, partial [Mucilaginibacter sp.]|nr:hypothetical protein [Mucilaginibacter sp.]